jgi:hypothetical protein
MFNLTRYVALSSVARNFGITKKLFASTSVVAEKQDDSEPQKPQNPPKKPSSMKSFRNSIPDVLTNYF